MVLVVVVCALLPVGAAGARSLELEQILASGGYTRDEAAVYRLLAFTRPELLPVPLRDPALRDIAWAEEQGIWRCGTPLVREVRRTYDALPADLRQLVDEALGKAPAGGADEGVMRETSGLCTDAAPNEVETEHFVIKWGNSYNGDGVDDLAEVVEAARARYVEDIGYQEPYGVGSGDWKLPLFIGNSGNGMPDISWSGGYATICSDYAGAYVVLSPDIANWSFTADVAPHELFHTVQFGYAMMGMDEFWYEATAVWAEDLTYPDVNGYLAFGYIYVEDPQIALADMTDFYHQYGMFYFPKAVQEFIDGGMDILRKTWENPQADITAAMGTVLESEYDLTFDDVFAEFTARAGRMEDYEDGALMSLPERVYTVLAYPDGADDVSDAPPQRYGTNYIELPDPGHDPPDTKLHFEFDGGGESTWVIGVIKHRAEDGKNKTMRVEVADDGTAVFDVIDVGTLYDNLVVAITWTGTGNSSPSYSWSVDMIEQTEPQGDDDDDDDSAGEQDPGDILGDGCAASPYDFSMDAPAGGASSSACAVAATTGPAPLALLGLLALALGARRRR